MKVYTLEIGCYSDRGLVGVYATAEAAMAAFTKGRKTFLRIDKEYASPVSEMRWYCTVAEPPIPDWATREWTNNGDWQDAASVREWEVELPAEGLE